VTPLNPHRPEPHTDPQTPAHQEASRLAERFQRLTAEQKADVGVILRNHGELPTNSVAEATVDLIDLKPMTLTALKAYFDRLDGGGSAPRRSHTR
jgi:hypothetical protein